MDGWEVLAELKADSITSTIPVIMVSVMADRTRGLAMGVADVLVKPVDQNSSTGWYSGRWEAVHQCNIIVIDDDDSSRGVYAVLSATTDGRPLRLRMGGRLFEVLERTLPAAIILDLVYAGDGWL